MLNGYIFLSLNQMISQTSAIFNGMLILHLSLHTMTDSWDIFRREVIQGFENPVFKEMPGLSQQASIDEVSISAGNHDFVKTKPAYGPGFFFCFCNVPHWPSQTM